MARVGKTRNTSGLLRNETRLSNPSVVFGKANPAGTIGQMWCPLLNHLARESLWMQHWLCQPPEPPAERCPCCQCWASVESGGPCPQHMYRGVFFLVLCLLQTFGVSEISVLKNHHHQKTAGSLLLPKLPVVLARYSVCCRDPWPCSVCGIALQLLLTVNF